MLKGAPEIVLARCTHYLSSSGAERPIDEEFLAEHAAAYERFGFMGERVIGALLAQAGRGGGLGADRRTAGRPSWVRRARPARGRPRLRPRTT